MAIIGTAPFCARRIWLCSILYTDKHLSSLNCKSGPYQCVWTCWGFL